MGREGLLAALIAEGLPMAPSRTHLLPSRDQCLAQSCTDPSETWTTGLSAAFRDARERPPGLQCDLQAAVGTSAKLIPVTFAQRRDVRASREQARWH